MKTTRFLSSVLGAVLLIMAFATAADLLGFAYNKAVVLAASATFVITMVALFDKRDDGVVLQAGIFKEVWTGEVIKKMRLAEMYAWTMAITKDYSRFVTSVGDEAQVIHLASFPIQPDVLVDNSTYPIPVQAMTTTDIPISLNKFQTKVTEVTDDALFANTTNPIQLHTQAHTDAILDNKFALGAWNICPAGDSVATPVIVATGASDGTGRKKLLWDDLITLKRRLDAAKVSNRPGSRIIALEVSHETDLASADQTFKDKYFDWATGKPYSALGFTFYPCDVNPYYNFTTLVKQSFGVTPTVAMRQASMFFSTDRVGKANGNTTVYLTPKTAETQKNTMAVRHYHLITRLMNEGVAAIVSPG